MKRYAKDKGLVYDNEERIHLEIQDVINLLNRLYDENQELKKENIKSL